MDTLHTHSQEQHIKTQCLDVQLPLTDAWEKLAPELKGRTIQGIVSVCDAFVHGVRIKLFDRGTTSLIVTDRLCDGVGLETRCSG